MNKQIDPLSQYEPLFEQLGVAVSRTLANRRGSLSVEVIRPDGEVWVLKINQNTKESRSDDRAFALAREVDLLRKHTDVIYDLYRAHGSFTNGQTWMATRKVQGEQVYNIVKALHADTEKTNEQKSSALCSIILRIAEEYARIHAAGFLHGDVQINHVLFETNEKESERVVVVDWGQGRYVENDVYPYRGGFIYFLPPEIAESVIGEIKPDNLLYTEKAEVYTIAFTLYWLYTNASAIDFRFEQRSELGFDDFAQMVIDGNLRSFSDVGALPNRQLETVLLQNMSKDVSARCRNPQEFFEALRGCIDFWG